MFKIGLDLGYGYTKGVNEAGKEVLIPSLVCDGYNRPLAGLFGGGQGALKDNLHLVVSDGLSFELFVGDLARREGRNISFAFDENKITHQTTRGLLAAAGYLLFPENIVPVHVVTGLPLEQYIHRKDEFKQMLSKFNVSIRHKDSQESKRISFAKATVFPQAAGAVYHAVWDERSKYLTKGSYLGLVDIGFKTTDFITFLMEDRLVLREDLSGTINAGISVIQAMADKLFTAKTGSKLDVPELMRLVDSGRLMFKGNELDFSSELEDAKWELSKNIKDRLKAVWGNKLNFFNNVFLAGGGAVTLEHILTDLHPNTITIKSPQFANAKGFLKVAEIEGRKAATG